MRLRVPWKRGKHSFSLRLASDHLLEQESLQRRRLIGRQRRHSDGRLVGCSETKARHMAKK